MGMLRQEWANMLPNSSVLALFVSRTFPECFIEIWWTKSKIYCKMFILDLITPSRTPTPSVNCPANFYHFCPFSRETEFSYTCIFWENLGIYNTFHKDVYWLLFSDYFLLKFGKMDEFSFIDSFIHAGNQKKPEKSLSQTDRQMDGRVSKNPWNVTDRHFQGIKSWWLQLEIQNK